MECLCCLLDHCLALGYPLGCSSDLLLHRYGRILGERHSRLGTCDARELDILEQVSQAARPLHPVSGRFPPSASLYPVWLLPRLDQRLRHAVAECGGFTTILFAEV